jgi:RNA polymerase sigma factor (sigma-70 family)
MDIAMPDLNGLEATARIVQEFPGVRVIVLSMYAHEEYVSRALKIGVSGYLLKDAGVAELELAIVAVARGEIYLSPSVSRHVVEEYVQRRTREPTVLERLTPRQREILQLVAEGHTTKEIAEQIHLSSKTVETYRTQLMDQLGIENMAGLIRFAIRSGIVSLDR